MALSVTPLAGLRRAEQRVLADNSTGWYLRAVSTRSQRATAGLIWAQSWDSSSGMAKSKANLLNVDKCSDIGCSQKCSGRSRGVAAGGLIDGVFDYLERTLVISSSILGQSERPPVSSLSRMMFQGTAKQIPGLLR